MPLYFRANLPGPFTYVRRVGGRRGPKSPSLFGMLFLALFQAIGLGFKRFYRWLVRTYDSGPSGQVWVFAIVTFMMVDVIILAVMIVGLG